MGALATKTPARLAGSAVLAIQSDDRLLRLFRDGHERAFDAIVQRYRRPLERYCAGILPESRSEDAVQQAFINAHSALRASDEPLQLKPWLYIVARNAALNMLRQNGWNYEQIPADVDGVLRPDQAVEQKLELQQTVAAVNELPGRQRDALVMREFEGRSYEEIALALGTGDGAVRQLLNRARGTLRAIATALVPPPIVQRAAASLTPTDGRRVAEVLGSLGTAGVVKVGATAVVAGSLVVGAVNAPLPQRDQHAQRDRATISAPQASAAKTETIAAASVLATGTSRGSAASARTNSGRNARSGHAQRRTHHPAGVAPGVQEHDGSRELGDDHTGSRSGSGTDDHRSGSSGETRTREHESGVDDSHSGSGVSGGSDDSTSASTEPTSGSGDSGSGDSATAPTTTTETSGSSDSSGSGSDGSLTSTPATPESGD